MKVRWDKVCKGVLIIGYLCFSLSVPIALAQEQKTLTYENEAMGVSLTGPEGWYIAPGDKVQTKISQNIGDITSFQSVKEAVKKLGILAVFTFYPYGSPVEFNPSIGLTTEPMPQEYSTVIKTAMDVAVSSIFGIKAMFKDTKIIKEPALITLGAREGAHFIYEGTAVRGYLELRIRCSAYMFLKENTVFTLAFTDKADNFDKNYQAFESSVNTFVLK
jgi:hypothetical protein